MSYVNVVNVHRKAASYLQEEYLGVIVGTTWPMSAELRFTELGYVKHSYKIRELFERNKAANNIPLCRLAEGDIDAILYSPQSYNAAEFLRYIKIKGFRKAKEFREKQCSAAVYIK